MMEKGRITLRQLLPAILLSGILWISACAGPAQVTSTPAGETAAVVTTISGEQTTPGAPGSENPPDADQMATSEAALENSGRSGPTLPPGDQTLAETPESPAAPTSASVQASSGGAATPNQSETGGAQATMSPDQLATSEAALENSGKTGPTPQGDTSPATRCLGGAGLILFAVVLVAARRYLR